MKHFRIYLFCFILLLAAAFRFQNLNWDQGFHLHPDERAIVLYTLPLAFPNSVQQLLNPTSTWNPHFFAYGSFPLYFLKEISSVASYFNATFSTYQDINLVGRAISAIADLLTLYTVFLIGKKLINRDVGIITMFLYGLAVLPIQLSHFYAVDTLLTLFISLTLYRLLLFYENPTIINSLKIGIAFGLALATKISSLVLLASIGSALCVDFILLFADRPHPRHWAGRVPKFLRGLIRDAFFIVIPALIILAICEPYAFLDLHNFIQQTNAQNQMTKSAFTFPYTLQYVGKIPYFYELKNIFFFGFGPFLSTIVFLGTLFITWSKIKKFKHNNSQFLILLTFFWIYFAIVGKFAIGFMRYMLPLYPLFSIFGAILVYQIELSLHKKLNRPTFLILNSLFVIIALIWPASFSNIYRIPNTRVTASDWINKNIPANTTIAIEHWDDGLPLYGAEKYQIQTLELYNADSDSKWTKINDQLSKSTYIIIASNRLYVPLQKLTNCSRLPLYFCYTRTAQYYKDLFSGKLGFKKVAEFSAEPEIPLVNIPIDDQSADESFTVYDHPKVIIYKKSLVENNGR